MVKFFLHAKKNSHFGHVVGIMINALDLQILTNHLIAYWVKVLSNKLSIYYCNPVKEEILFYLKELLFTLCVSVFYWNNPLD